MPKRLFLITAWITRKLPPLLQNRRVLRWLYNPDTSFGKYEDSIVKTNGVKYWVNPQSGIEWEILFTGQFEAETTKLIEKYSAHGSIIIDVGANVGCHTMLMAKNAKRVLAIEPVPKFQTKIRRNMELNGFKNIEIENYALADKPDEATLYYSEPSNTEKHHSGESGSLLPIDPQIQNPIKVKIKTLDEVAGGLEKISLIKIDTDGYDFRVLLGGKETIKKHRPVVIFEWDERCWTFLGDTLEMAKKFFKELNYELTPIENNYLAIPKLK